MKKKHIGRMYKLCEDYIRYCNFRYEMYAHNLSLTDDLFDELIRRVEDDIEDTVDKIQKLLNE